MATIELPLAAAGRLLHEPARRTISRDAVHVTLVTRAACTAVLRLIDTKAPAAGSASLAEATATSRGFRPGLHLVEVSVPRSGPEHPVTRLDLLVSESDLAATSPALTPDLALLLGAVSIVDTPTISAESHSGVLPIVFGPFDFGDLEFSVDLAQAAGPMLEAIRGGLHEAVSPATSARITELIRRVAPGVTRRRRLATVINSLSAEQLAELARQIRSPQPGGFDTVLAAIALSVFESGRAAYRPVANFAGSTLANLFGVPLTSTWMPAWGHLSERSLEVGAIASVADFLTAAMGSAWGASSDQLALRGTIDLGEIKKVPEMLSATATGVVSDEAVGRRYEHFAENGRLTAALACSPFGFGSAEVNARLLLPDFENHPSVSGWIPPEARPPVRRLPWVSRAELLRAAGPAGRDILADPSWTGDLGRLARAVPPGRVPLRDKDLVRDYFPHGGLVAALELVASPLITNPPPFSDIVASLAAPTAAERRAAVNRLLDAAVPSEKLGDLALYIPAPNPADPSLSPARQLAALRRRGAAAAGAGAWDLDHAVLAGTLNGSLLGLRLSDAPFVADNGVVELDVTDHLPAWLTRNVVSDATIRISGPAGLPTALGIEGIRALLDGVSLEKVASAAAYSSVEQLATQGIDVEDVDGVHDRLQHGLLDLVERTLSSPRQPLDEIARLFAQVLPKVKFSAKLGALELPNRITSWLGPGSGQIHLSGYSPFFNPGSGAPDASAAIERLGGLRIKLPSVRLDLGPVKRTLRAPSFEFVPARTSRSAPGLKGTFTLPSFGFRPFKVTTATLDIDTQGTSPVVARLKAEPLGLGPMRIEPLTGRELDLTIDAATGRVELGPSRLAIRTPIVDLVAEIRGSRASQPFIFSTAGEWSSTARLTQLVIRNPFRPTDERIVNLTSSRTAGEVLVSGKAGIASLRVAWTRATRRKVTLFPWLGFSSTGATDVFINAGGDLLVSLPTRLPRTVSGLMVDGKLNIGLTVDRPFASLADAKASLDWLPGETFSGSFTVAPDKLECTDGTLSGAALAGLFAAASDNWRLTLMHARRGTSLTLTGSVPGFDLGVFTVGPLTGRNVPIAVGPDGLSFGPARIEAALPGLALRGVVHGDRANEPVSITARRPWQAKVSISTLEVRNPFSRGALVSLPVQSIAALSAVGTTSAALALPKVDPIRIVDSLIGKIGTRGSDALTIEPDGTWNCEGNRSLAVGALSITGVADIGVRAAAAGPLPFMSVAGTARVGPLSFASTLSWDGSWWRAASLPLGSTWLGQSGALEARANGWDLQARGGAAPQVRLTATTGLALRLFGATVSDVGSLTIDAKPTGLTVAAATNGWVSLAANLVEVRGDDLRLDFASGSLRCQGAVRALRQGSSWRINRSIGWDVDIDTSTWATDLVSGSGFGSVLPSQGFLRRTSGTRLELLRHSNGLFGLRLFGLVFEPLWNSYTIDAGIAPDGEISVDLGGKSFVAAPLTLNAGTITVTANLLSSNLAPKWKMLAGTVTSSLTDWPTLDFPESRWASAQDITGSGSETPKAQSSWKKLPGTVDAVEYKCTTPKVEVKLQSSSPRLKPTVNLGSFTIRPTGNFFGVQGLFTKTINPGARTITSDGSIDGLGLSWPSPARPLGWAGPWPPLLPDLSGVAVKLYHLVG